MDRPPRYDWYPGTHLAAGAVLPDSDLLRDDDGEPSRQPGPVRPGRPRQCRRKAGRVLDAGLKCGNVTETGRFRPEDYSKCGRKFAPPSTRSPENPNRSDLWSIIVPWRPILAPCSPAAW